ncbi:MAG: hypothetical protein J4451_00465 [DPANN group archaeon]|nr:hypothetical protein [DPANN group archaeon]
MVKLQHFKHGLRKGIKDHQFDFYRWLIYAATLVIIAFASMAFPILYWVFVIVAAGAFADFIWHKFTKYTHVKHKH